MKRALKKKVTTKKSTYAKELRGLEKWVVDDTAQTISREFIFGSYLSALAFIAKVAVHAEILNHHPTIIFSFTSVVVSSTTHDKNNNLTKKDFELARKIDGLKVHC